MKSWVDKYTTTHIPYLSKGRTMGGCDCWGLVKMVYESEFDTQLPSFDDKYSDSSNSNEATAALSYRDGWTETNIPQEGDVIVFRLAGLESHVGLWLSPTEFLHSTEGVGVVVERLDSLKWKQRIAGVFKHTPNAVQVVGSPHPLQTTKIHTTGRAGESLLDMVQSTGVQAEWLKDGHAWVNSVYIPFDTWKDVKPLAGDLVEFRLVAKGGKGGLRSLLMIVVAVAAAWVTGGASIAGLTLTTAGTTTAAVAGAVVATAGSMLVNALVPIKPPAQSSADLAEGRRLLSLSGGANSEAQYAPIPVVLGQHRFAPPLASKMYSSSDGTDRYLHLLLCWGVGRLEVKDIVIGDTPLSSYKDYEIASVSGVAGEDLSPLMKIVGNDIDEDSVGVELKNAESWSTRKVGGKPTRIEALVNFPQGLCKINKSGGVEEYTADIAVEYRKVGDVNWFSLAPDNLEGSSIPRTSLKPSPPAKVERGLNYPETVPKDVYRWDWVYATPKGLVVVSGDPMFDPSPSAVRSVKMI